MILYSELSGFGLDIAVYWLLIREHLEIEHTGGTIGITPSHNGLIRKGGSGFI